MSKKLLVAWVALAALIALVVTVQNHHLHQSTIEFEVQDAADQFREFSWADVVPSDALEWTDCYTALHCARLNVPLNYSEPYGAKAIIAMTRYPAAVPVDSPQYHGPILMNPGGPGGSGVDIVNLLGAALAQIVGPEFDIIGFDPRGVARSTPRASFFETDVERILFRHATLRDLNASADALGRSWAQAQVHTRLAAERAGDFLPHINTDNTARDMLHIVEAHGREKLQYWGFSYGSVLGAVFAAMFPDKVERLIIDGVVDAENYFDTLWSNNLLDADKALQIFFDRCVAAGPKGCAFYAPTSEAISQNLTTLYDSVRVRPVPVKTASGYGVIDYNSLRLIVLSSLYWPLTMFGPLAQILAGVARGDGAPLMDILKPSPFQCSCDPSEHRFDSIQDSQTAIICNDGRLVPSGFDEAEQHYNNMVKTSSLGSIWANVRISCTGWNIPKQHFQGPVSGNTSFPLLIIGNTADPVTPLSSAEKMAKAFPGSVVLTQDCPGHTSFAAPSACTWRHIREYFYSGLFPDPDTVCSVLGSSFAEEVFEEREQTVLSVTEHRVFDAYKAVHRDSWSKAVNLCFK
ncbi:TAP-like protein-domain-containing protein [Mycena crocata]|nr:TAP-like protein-domain-containing protein [Mycena crocata]